jgi:hypothetical protein
VYPTEFSFSEAPITAILRGLNIASNEEVEDRISLLKGTISG